MAAKNTVASGNWSAGATWNSGTVPVAGDTVTIQNGHIISGDFTSGLSLGSLTINSGQLILSNNKVLDISGNLSIIPTIGTVGYMKITDGCIITVAGNLTIDAKAGLNTVADLLVEGSGELAKLIVNGNIEVKVFNASPTGSDPNKNIDTATKTAIFTIKNNAELDHSYTANVRKTFKIIGCTTANYYDMAMFYVHSTNALYTPILKMRTYLTLESGTFKVIERALIKWAADGVSATYSGIFFDNTPNSSLIMRSETGHNGQNNGRLLNYNDLYDYGFKIENNGKITMTDTNYSLDRFVSFRKGDVVSLSNLNNTTPDAEYDKTELFEIIKNYNESIIYFKKFICASAIATSNRTDLNSAYYGITVDNAKVFRKGMMLIAECSDGSMITEQLADIDFNNNILVFSKTGSTIPSGAVVINSVFYVTGFEKTGETSIDFFNNSALKLKKPMLRILRTVLTADVTSNTTDIIFVSNPVLFRTGDTIMIENNDTSVTSLLAQNLYIVTSVDYTTGQINLDRPVGRTIDATPITFIPKTGASVINMARNIRVLEDSTRFGAVIGSTGSNSGYYQVLNFVGVEITFTGYYHATTTAARKNGFHVIQYFNTTMEDKDLKIEDCSFYADRVVANEVTTASHYQVYLQYSAYAFRFNSMYCRKNRAIIFSACIGSAIIGNYISGSGASALYLSYTEQKIWSEISFNVINRCTSGMSIPGTQYASTRTINNNLIKYCTYGIEFAGRVTQLTFYKLVVIDCSYRFFNYYSMGGKDTIFVYCYFSLISELRSSHIRSATHLYGSLPTTNTDTLHMQFYEDNFEYDNFALMFSGIYAKWDNLENCFDVRNVDASSNKTQLLCGIPKYFYLPANCVATVSVSIKKNAGYTSTVQPRLIVVNAVNPYQANYASPVYDYPGAVGYNNPLANGVDYVDISDFLTSNEYVTGSVQLGSKIFGRYLLAVLYIPTTYSTNNEVGWKQKHYEIEITADPANLFPNNTFKLPSFRGVSGGAITLEEVVGYNTELLDHYTPVINDNELYHSGILLNIDPSKPQYFLYSADGINYEPCDLTTKNRVNKIICPSTGYYMKTVDNTKGMTLKMDGLGRYYLKGLTGIATVYDIYNSADVLQTAIGDSTNLYVATYKVAGNSVLMSSGASGATSVLVGRYTEKFIIGSNGSGISIPVLASDNNIKVRSLRSHATVKIGLENGTPVTISGTHNVNGIPSKLGFNSTSYSNFDLYGLQIYSIPTIDQTLAIFINQKAMTYYGIT